MVLRIAFHQKYNKINCRERLKLIFKRQNNNVCYQFKDICIMYEYNTQQDFIRRNLRKTILGSMTSFFLRKNLPTEKEITYQLILMSYLLININSFYRPGVNNQLVTIFIIFDDNRMIAVHNIYQDSKILASVVCFAELVYNWFMSRLARAVGIPDKNSKSY